MWKTLTDPTSRGHQLIKALLRVKPLRAPLASAAVRRAKASESEAEMPVSLILDLLDSTSAMFAFATNTGDLYDVVNGGRSQAGEIPSANVVATARGLAGVYSPLSLGGAVDGVRLVSSDGIRRMATPQSVTEVDAVLGGPTSYTMGFAKSWPNPREGSGVIFGESAFGTPGAGGQLGFADPAYRMSFAYIMNRHGSGTGLNARGQSLVDATYAALGSPGRTRYGWSNRQA